MPNQHQFKACEERAREIKVQNILQNSTSPASKRDESAKLQLVIPSLFLTSCIEIWI